LASRVTYKASVAKDLKRLDKPTSGMLLTRIETDLAANPELGKALTGTFKGLHRFRVGDYRVIYSRSPGSILVLRIGHRKDIYRAR
jgi:mRNA interferase RelE/StbE